MDKADILITLELLGANNVLAHARNVQCSCLLARWDHPSGKDSRPSMGISIDPKGPSLVHCFACGFRGTMEILVDRLAFHRSGEDLTSIIARVVELEELQLEAVVERMTDYEHAERGMSEVVLPETYLERFRGIAPAYLLDRGIRIDPTMRTWEIGYDDEKHRAIMPVRNRDGKLVGAVGRGVRPDPRPKYLNYWKFEKGLYLYGEHLLPQEPCTVVVVEGPIDALRVWQECHDAGVDVNVVALMGAKATWKQVTKLARYASDVVLFLDNDAAGWDGTKDLVERLGAEMLVTAVKYPDPVGGDPDEMGPRLVEMLENPDLIL